jgi:hypothetical protein
MEAVKHLEAAVKDSPAYGVRNVQKVAAGTWEAFPGPTAASDPVGASTPITGDPGKWS